MIRVTNSNRKLLFFTLGFFISIILISIFLGSRYARPILRKPAADQYGGQFINPVWNGEQDISELMHKTRIIGNEDTRRQAFDANGRSRVRDVNLAKALRAVATIYSEDNGTWTFLGTAVLTESRSVLLTVAHILINDGVSSLGLGKEINLSKLHIHFPACNEVYAADKFVRGSDGEMEKIGRDIGVIVLRGQACTEVVPIKLVSRKSVLNSGLINVGAPIVVAGSYTPLTVYEQRIKELGSNSDSESGFNTGYDSKTAKIYFDRCNLQAWRTWTDKFINQAIIAHDCDTGKGGSGGPIFTAVNNQWYLLGLHTGTRVGNYYNLGLLAADWIETLLRETMQSIGSGFPETVFPLGNSPKDVIKFSI